MISGLEYVHSHGFSSSATGSGEPLTPSSLNSASHNTWTDTSSQSSDSSSTSGAEVETRYDVEGNTYIRADVSTQLYSNPTYAQLAEHAPILVKDHTQRLHPRRTSRAAGTICPPTLLRQSDRKVNFVDNLVDTSASLVEAIWPQTSISCHTGPANKGVLPIRKFIQETLRRSRTSYSTLQVALYYLILIKSHVPRCDGFPKQSQDNHSQRVLQCGRRMFLAALILASKYLQDRNYSTRAWSKISGLGTHEINQNEVVFLLAVKWKLHITDVVFNRWSALVLLHTPPCLSGIPSVPTMEWRNLISRLTPELDDFSPSHPYSFAHNLDMKTAISRPSIAGVSAPICTTHISRTINVNVEHKPVDSQNNRLLLSPRYTPDIPAADLGSITLQSNMAPLKEELQRPAQYYQNKAWIASRTASLGYRTSLTRTSSSSSAYSTLSISSPESMVSDISSDSFVSSHSSELSSYSPVIKGLEIPRSAPKAQNHARCGFPLDRDLVMMPLPTDSSTFEALPNLKSYRYDCESVLYLGDNARELAAAEALYELRGDAVKSKGSKRAFAAVAQDDIAHPTFSGINGSRPFVLTPAHRAQRGAYMASIVESNKRVRRA